MAFFTNTNESIHAVHGQIHHYHNIPLIVTFHPAELLQSPADKKNAWQDLLCVQNLLMQTS
jgi:uracil-DNA glycosylase family 4